MQQKNNRINVSNQCRKVNHSAYKLKHNSLTILTCCMFALGGTGKLTLNCYFEFILINHMEKRKCLTHMYK